MAPCFSAPSRCLRLSSNVADGYAALFGEVLDDLDELLATLLGERRERQTDGRPVVAGGDPEVGVADRLLDRPQRGAVMRANEQLPGLVDLDRRQLDDRDLRAVVVDSEPLDQGRRGRPVRTVWNCDCTWATALSILSMVSSSVSSITRPSVTTLSCPARTELPATVRSEGGQVRGQKFGGNPWSQVDRLPMGYRSNSSAVVDDGPDVPAGDDVAQRPGLDMSNTTMGILLSRQKAIAVASITLRPLVIVQVADLVVLDGVRFDRGSESYTPSTPEWVPLSRASASISAARRAAGVGGEERVPGAGGEDHHRPFSRWRTALRRMYGSAMASRSPTAPRSPRCVRLLGVLQSEGVHHRAEHADVVGLRGIAGQLALAARSCHRRRRQHRRPRPGSAPRR